MVHTIGTHKNLTAACASLQEVRKANGVPRAAAQPRSTSKFEADKEAVVQTQQELVLSWTKSLDGMPSTGCTRGHDVDERLLLSYVSPTDLNASSEESDPASPLECATLDSLRFLGISQTRHPLFALRGIDYRECSRHMPACSILRGHNLSERHTACHGAWCPHGQHERSTLEVNARFSTSKDRNLPLMPVSRMKAASDMRIHYT